LVSAMAAGAERTATESVRAVRKRFISYSQS
jgi:hypothetical protein